MSGDDPNKHRRIGWATPVYVVAAIVLFFTGLILLRDFDPVERLLAPFLNALGLNG
jgi:hypothetical protein